MIASRMNFFLNALKLQAKVIALNKKCDYKDPENYRSINLLISLSKVSEKLLCNQMIQFFVKNDLFTSVQFGCRSNQSCVHEISERTNFIRDAIDKNLIGQTCFIDLRKIFESLHHFHLLAKYYMFGFR